MLFEEIDFEKKEVKSSLNLKGIKHSNKWDVYYESYSYCVNQVINGGLSKRYFFNSKCRPILFLIRHSWELYLKLLVTSNNLKLDFTHDFKDLFLTLNQHNVNHQIEEEIFNELNFEGDGACFRYYSDKDEKPYFNYKSKIVLSEILKNYNQNRNNQTENFRLAFLCEKFQYNNKKIKWNLTLHVGEARQLMHIKTEYDQIIEFLLNGILKNELNLSKTYLPLLFLIRHSLEIGLKYNISEIQRKSQLIKDKDYADEHSLFSLYKCYSDFLNQIEVEKLNRDTRIKLKQFQATYESLNKIIHNLDSNSNYFRFPIIESEQKDLNLNNNTLYKIIKLYYITDQFITFTNDVLEDEGILIDQNKRL